MFELICFAQEVSKESITSFATIIDKNPLIWKTVSKCSYYFFRYAGQASFLSSINKNNKFDNKLL